MSSPGPSKPTFMFSHSFQISFASSRDYIEPVGLCHDCPLSQRLLHCEVELVSLEPTLGKADILLNSALPPRAPLDPPFLPNPFSKLLCCNSLISPSTDLWMENFHCMCQGRHHGCATRGHWCQEVIDRPAQSLNVLAHKILCITQF